MDPLSNQLNSMQIDTTDNNEDFEDLVDGQDLVGNDFGEDEDFEICDDGKHNEEDDRFDEVVGQLQEILIDPKFSKL